MSRVHRRAPLPLVLAATLVSVAMMLPLLYLVARSVGSGAAAMGETLWTSRTADLLARTALLTAAVTSTAIIIGVALAWLMTRTDMPGRRAFTVLVALPLAIPTYVGAYAFIAAFGPRGMLQRVLAPLGVDRLPEIYGFVGAWLVLSLFTYPYVMLTVRAALRNLDPSIEEAARSLGLPARQTFRRIVLPQLRPSIAAGGLLVALYTLHDLGAVALMRYDTFARAIYTAYQGSFNRGRAATLSLVLIAVILLVLWGESRWRGRAAYYRTHASAARAAPIQRLARKGAPAVAACVALVTLALVVPVGVITTWFVRAVAAGEPVGTAVTSASHSLQAAAVTAFVAVIAAWPIAVLGVRFPGRAARTAERVTYIGYALPGLVVALSLVFVAVRVTPALYQTFPMLLFAYVVLFLPQSGGALRTSLLQVSPALEEASHSLGAGRARTLRRVIAPLVRSGAVAGWALVFLTTMKELPATLLLAPTGFRTLATQVWSAADVARFDLAAAPALILIALAAIPLVGVVLSERAR